jgi:hypothetical protein
MPYHECLASQRTPRKAGQASGLFLATLGYGWDQGFSNFPTQAKTRLEWATQPEFLRLAHELNLTAK